MVTKYILNSGGINNSADQGSRFFNEMVKDLGAEPRILMCHFAQQREDWEIKYQKYIDSMIAVLSSSVRPRFEMAWPDQFASQVQKSDVVYIHGGDEQLIQYRMRAYHLPSVWEGKVVATKSASSHLLSKYYWTCDWRQCAAGLGILPIKFLAHYQSEYGGNNPRGPIDWEQARKQLEKYGDTSLPVHALKEGDYIVINV